jgi:UTRA domain
MRSALTKARGTAAENQRQVHAGEPAWLIGAQQVAGPAHAASPGAGIGGTTRRPGLSGQQPGRVTPEAGGGADDGGHLVVIDLRGPHPMEAWSSRQARDRHPDIGRIGHPYGIHGIFEDQGHVMTRIREEVSARMPRPDERRDLRLPPGVPVLDVFHTSLDQQGQPYELTRFVMRADLTGLLYDVPVE